MGNSGSLCNDLTISLPGYGANGKFIAVTGADSFIGAHVVKILLRKGYIVRGTVQDLDPAKVGFLKVLPQAYENLSLFKRDILDEGCFDDVFEGCDCVFHLACPKLKLESEMKMPDVDMIDAVRGMRNVLHACRKAGVRVVVITSSMAAAAPKHNRPKMLNESHWADHEVQMKKGAYHNACRTLAERAAVEFLANMSTGSRFRLVRICPTFTVGPMLQPTVNSSMERFAAILGGTRHKHIPNRSISLIDVRDTAAHHVAAYEKGLEGRFFSTTEAWPWTLIYQALKFHCPRMNCPLPLPLGTRIGPVKEYSKTRANVLGVKERSMMTILRDAVKECQEKQLFNTVAPSFQNVAGYYDLGSGNGTFLFVDVQCSFKPDATPEDNVHISYVIGGQTKPTVISISEDLLPGESTGSFYLSLVNYAIELQFQILTGQPGQNEKISVSGLINGTTILGFSYITYVPYSVFTGSYITEDQSDTVTLALGAGDSNSITFSDGTIVDVFTYDPVKRRFSLELPHSEFTMRLYMNVAAGNGLMIRFVQFILGVKGTGSTKVYFKNAKPSVMPKGPIFGANSLAPFAGYYPLKPDGSSFVSIVDVTQLKNPYAIGVCTDGINSIQYDSFIFQNNTLTFLPKVKAPVITLKTIPSSIARTSATVTLPNGEVGGQSQNFFSAAPFEAFGYRTLTSKNATLSITPGNDKANIVLTMNGAVVFDTTDYEYNSVEQAVLYDNLRLNFCYNLKGGVTCGITKTEGGFNNVLFAYPKPES